MVHIGGIRTSHVRGYAFWSPNRCIAHPWVQIDPLGSVLANNPNVHTDIYMRTTSTPAAYGIEHVPPP